MRLRTFLLLGLLVLFAVVGTIGFLLRDVGKQEMIRFVRSGGEGGALMAVDADGLRQLNSLYALPKTCTLANTQTTPMPEAMFLCFPRPKPIAREMIVKGVILLPEGTKATYMGRRFVLPGGRLVQPYAANTYDMARDGAVEVERIRITQPPHENLEGWVYTQLLGRGGSPPL